MMTSMILCWAPKRARCLLQLIFFTLLQLLLSTPSVFVVNFGCGFLTLSGIGLSNYSTKSVLGVTWELFILLAELSYKDIKMNDFSFGILLSSQNWALDQVLIGRKLL